jgi:CRISPR-associated endonuclease/helicase Cas3
MEYIAHIRESDGKIQTVSEHLFESADFAATNAGKLGLQKIGNLLGLLHDLGKYSKEFQAYIQSSAGLLDQDVDESVNVDGKKGRIDHSTAGSQHIWLQINGEDKLKSLLSQTISLCIASHHSGLIDCLSPNGYERLIDRMRKQDEKTHLQEALIKADEKIISKARELISDKDIYESFKKKIELIISGEKRLSNEINKKGGLDTGTEIRIRFKIGLLVRFLFSSLIDADRMNTADFEKPKTRNIRLNKNYKAWPVLINRVEERISRFKAESVIDGYRKKISDECKSRAVDAKGIFTLTVPTGGGKTLASLRFALWHAEKHKMDHVFYIIPYTSIIDQNADIARKILEPEGAPEDSGKIVLEHHSNLADEKDTWRGKILAENWDAPVVFTTTVQFLETLFGSGTRDARRMHQLVNSIIILDEIQTLPIKSIHMFCNAINFLVDHCGCTAVLCTATQPLLNGVDKMKGHLDFANENELISDVSGLFKNLGRIEFVPRKEPGGWAEDEIIDLAREALNESGSCLIIVNTTKMARNLFRIAKEKKVCPYIYHLSANMCPTHRRVVLADIQEKLVRDQSASVLCISTQVIEAGVDIDFGAVIRSTAGLDSIAQAAGRCNRNGRLRNKKGELVKGKVYILNPKNEAIDNLTDIKIGKEIAERVISEMASNPELYGPDLLHPKTLNQYFQYYFFDRKDQMDYPVKPGAARFLDRHDSLMNMLSENSQAVAEHNRQFQKPPTIYLRQSFETASLIFTPIDSVTRGVVVPFGQEGKEIIAALCAGFDPETDYKLLRRAQRFSVNTYSNVFDKLTRSNAIYEAQQGTGIWCLKEEFYSSDFGLSDLPVFESTPADWIT